MINTNGLPKSWRESTIEESCRLVTDGTHNSPSVQTEGEYLYITSKNIRPFRLDLSTAGHVSKEVHMGIHRACPVEFGDVLFVKDGANTGNAAVNSLHEPFSMLSSVALLKPKRDILDPGYLVQWLNSDEGYRRMTQNMSGSAIRRLILDEIRSRRFPLPPLPEQRRIAAILDKADAIRRKREEGIRLTDELLRCTFLEMFGDPEKNPKGWEFQPVSEIVSEMEGGKSILADTEDTHSTQYRVLKVSAVTWADYRPYESKPVPADYVPPAAHIAKKGDLLFSRANTTELVGATVYVFDTPPNHLLPDKLWRFVWRDDRQVDPQYIRVLFMTSAIKRELGKRATGTSGSMKNISKAKLMTIPIPVPPIELQRKFGTFAMAQHKALSDRRTAAALTSDLFQALVQRAFRGEL